MVDLIGEALALQRFLERQGWCFCFIGGFAVYHWGEPRLTLYLDLALMTGFGGEAEYVDTLLREYQPRIADARTFALERRVLLLRSESGIGIDISLAAFSYEDIAINRAVAVEILPGSALRLCSAEDLIVMKLFAGRDADLRDVRSVIVRQGLKSLDWRYIDRSIAGLEGLKEGTDLRAQLGEIRQSCEEP